MKWILQHKLLIIGIIAGSVIGFLYWNFIGCNSGTCMITSKWHNSTAYGAVMGGLIVSMFTSEKNKKQNEE
jgi:outer membrane lipoprotein SlyB